MANQHSRPTQRRNLGSPFKSPEAIAKMSKSQNLNMTTSSTLQTPDNVKSVQYEASPTPVRHTAVKSLAPLSQYEEVPVADPTKQTDSLTCPICSEHMLTLSQLNQHIDDAHQEKEMETDSSNAANNLSNGGTSVGRLLGTNDVKRWFSGKVIIDPVPDFESENQRKTPQKRKTISLDMLDDERGFSFSDNGDGFRESPVSSRVTSPLPNSGNSPYSKHKRITRTHWKHPSTTPLCSIRDCGKTLNVKNGIVNCRKCGLLFCNEHTQYRVKLKNSEDVEKEPPVYNSTFEGTWSKCCCDCYYSKPDLAVGTQVNSRDLTSQFAKKRQELLDDKQLARVKVQKRFIKLADLLAETSFHERNESKTLWGAIQKTLIDSKSEAEKEIIGYDNWQSDKEATNCTICFVRFNIVIRRHHCRLCGNIVCDDPYGARKSCSIVVPLSKLLEKLHNLNYSRLVKDNLKTLLHEDSIKFRCCVDCKNSLLYDWKLLHLRTPKQNETEIFLIYNAILAQKHQISQLLPKYAKHIDTTSDEEESYTNRLRIKIMTFLKDFENLTTQFRGRFFILENNKLLVIDDFAADSRLITNIYQSSIMFLQDNLIWYKQLNDKHKEIEQQRLKQSLEERAKEETPEVPRLTKKQIRELREQLMVMNEQKFLVENMIMESTKARRFEELSSLEQNKRELDMTIENLETELGEFGF